MKRFLMLIALAAAMAVPGRAAIWYVATNGLDAAAGTNWATARQTIQAAVDAATAGDTVLVSNGLYDTGARTALGGLLLNRVVATNGVLVRSVNGPDATFIVGAFGNFPNDGTQVRCAFLGGGSVLAGFTLTGGSANSSSFFAARDPYGGGIWCELSALVSNCVIVGNKGFVAGGGIYGGTATCCRIEGNTVMGDGGGAAFASLSRCVVLRNSARTGGGVTDSSLRSCLLAWNGANLSSGGAVNSSLENCTVYENTSTMGAALSSATIRNCIVISNAPANLDSVTAYASCSVPLPSGAGNISTVPRFAEPAATNFHLLPPTSCIDQGSNSYVTEAFDLDGQLRIVNDTVDIGAYEDQVSSLPPLVDNASGGTGISPTGAILNATLLAGGGTSTVLRIYWGTSDGGTNAAAWTNVCSFGFRANGPHSTNISGLTADTRYYYRAWASNPVAVAWAPATTSFIAYLPLGVLPAGIDFGPVTTGLVHEMAFTVTNRGIVPLTGDVRVAGAGFLLPGSTNFTLAPGESWSVPVRFAPDVPQAYAGSAIFRSSGGTATNTLFGAGVPKTVWHVAPGGNDVLAGTNWTTAKATIQAAIDVARSNDVVLVSNGVYATGARIAVGPLLTRVVITGAIAVVSLNGPAFTTIVGESHVNGPPVDGVRGVYIASNGFLSGFTVTNGHAMDISVTDENLYGGGIYCEPGAAISNCVLTGNFAAHRGGGLYGGTARNSLLIGNGCSTEGGGAWRASLFDCQILSNQCTHGGGAFDSLLERCVLRSNDAEGGFGGGAFFGELRNCLLVLNRAGNGGGANSAYLLNCTVASNTATSEGGGTFSSTLVNSIVYGNVGSAGFNGVSNTVDFSCIDALPTNGTGNIANDPEFLDAAAGDYRLKATSRAIGKGNPALAAGSLDVEGNPRTVSGSVDMGAYQYQLPAGYWAWVAAATNGQTNIAQSASGDGYPNLLKYATGGSPTNADHVARLFHSATGGLLTLSFNRNTNAYDVTILVEGGYSVASGAAWRPIATNFNGSWGGATNVTESAAGNPVNVSVRDASAGTSNRFLRLRITRP